MMKNKIKKSAVLIIGLSMACCMHVLAKPNIVLILADDMGYGDVGYHGVKDIITPNIDRIAAEGVYFTRGYVSASTCGPSRAGLLSGVYQQKFGCGENASITVKGSSGTGRKTEFSLAGLPVSQANLAEMLKKLGYKTGVIGKWHLGGHESMRPNARGFDFFYGFLNGAHSYTEWTDRFTGNKDEWPVFRNRKRLPPRKDVYLTDLFSEEAVGFIERSAGDPFFLYLSYNAVHAPWQVPEKYLERTKGLTDSENRNFFAAMVLAMDDGIGRVYGALEKNGALDNTVIIFLSDNGTPQHQGLKNTPRNHLHRTPEKDYMSSAGKFRGFKGDTYEGGLLVPFCIRWPGKIEPGSRYELPVSALDIVPTLVQGVKSDGVNLLPYINAEKTGRPHDVLYWRRDNDYAIRKGDWKLAWNDGNGTHTIKLFNLADDPGEYRDLADKYPEKTQALQDLFDAWDNALPDNKQWGGPWNRKRYRDESFSVSSFNKMQDKGDVYRKIWK